MHFHTPPLERGGGGEREREQMNAVKQSQEVMGGGGCNPVQSINCQLRVSDSAIFIVLHGIIAITRCHASIC